MLPRLSLGREGEPQKLGFGTRLAHPEYQGQARDIDQPLAGFRVPAFGAGAVVAEPQPVVAALPAIAPRHGHAVAVIRDAGDAFAWPPLVPRRASPDGRHNPKFLARNLAATYHAVGRCGNAKDTATITKQSLAAGHCARGDHGFGIAAHTESFGTFWRRHRGASADAVG